MKKLKKNFAGIFALLLVLIASFLFPLYSFQALGEDVPSGNKYTAFNIYKNTFLELPSYLKKGFGESLQLVMGILLSIIIVLYFLNGAGIIKNKFSRYASYFTILYFLLSLINYNILNDKYGSEFFGLSISSVSIGFGSWMLFITGIIYLIFSKNINNAFKKIY